MNFSIAAQFSATISLSPNCFQTVQGTITPASAQPRRIISPPYWAVGETPGNPPVSLWESRTSRVHLWKKASVFAKKVPVSVKTCVSAIQPRRSFRCGQSVGTER